MHQDLISDVFSLDPGIRYVGIVDNFGECIEGGMREGVSSINPRSEEQRLYLQATLSRGMSNTWSKYFEDLMFSIIAHKKLTVFQFPLGQNVLLVTAEPVTSFDVAKKISRLIK